MHSALILVLFYSFGLERISNAVISQIDFDTKPI